MTRAISTSTPMACIWRPGLRASKVNLPGCVSLPLFQAQALPVRPCSRWSRTHCRSAHCCRSARWATRVSASRRTVSLKDRCNGASSALHHGRLAQESGTANRYIPGENLPDKSFIVEEVEVRNSLTDEHRTLCIVTQMTLKRPSDVVVDKRDEQHARVWLSIHLSGASGVDQLTVVHGPGQIDIDEDGKPYYQADAASPAHFCVVGVVWRLSRITHHARGLHRAAAAAGAAQSSLSGP